MKILVTGSAGHLGEGIMRALDNRYQLTGLDIQESELTGVVGSVTDRDLVRGMMRGVDAVLHTATLHKPHVVTHSKQSFVDTNISGTLVLLEEALKAGVGAFIFTSTTSVFGDALRPPHGEPAAWITEEVTPQPKNIYGVTKAAAEDLCQLFYKKYGLPSLVLRTSRFFPEADDRATIRDEFDDANAKVNEFLYRRVDIEDIVDAQLAAVSAAERIGFDRFIISASTPFQQSDLSELRSNPATVVERYAPEFAHVYAQLGWRMFSDIERVYVNEKARRILGWRPRYDFQRMLKRVQAGQEPRSPLASQVGAKGYHDEQFEVGPYPVD